MLARYRGPGMSKDALFQLGRRGKFKRSIIQHYTIVNSNVSYS
jgi:hypothetical protein